MTRGSAQARPPNCLQQPRAHPTATEAMRACVGGAPARGCCCRLRPPQLLSSPADLPGGLCDRLLGSETPAVALIIPAEATIALGGDDISPPTRDRGREPGAFRILTLRVDHADAPLIVRRWDGEPAGDEARAGSRSRAGADRLLRPSVRGQESSKHQVVRRGGSRRPLSRDS